MKSRKFDIIIFGASGHIGRYTVLEAVARLKNFKWAIAGRNKEKLQFVLNWASERTQTNLSHIPICIANADDEKSLTCLSEKCRVLVNCCGPPQLWNEAIVNSCIKSETHYVDGSNDAFLNELIQLHYHAKAMENKTYVMSACGFHSFLIEMGLNILQHQFEGTVNHVDAYVQYDVVSSNISPGPVFSATAWRSLIMSSASIGDLPLLRKDIRQKQLPVLLPKQPLNQLLHKPDNDSQITQVRFPLIDQQTVERSQYYFYILDNQRPVQFYKYLVFPSYFLGFLFIIWTLVVSLLAQFDKSRNLVVTYPRLFSLGLCSPNGPDEVFMQNISFKIVLNATGWSQKLQKPIYESNDESFDRDMSVEICGSNPFYGVACLCLLLSAILLLEDQAKMPNTGGVYSPAVAFKKTSVLNKLAACENLTIDICE